MKTQHKTSQFITKSNKKALKDFKEYKSVANSLFIKIVFACYEGKSITRKELKRTIRRITKEV